MTGYQSIFKDNLFAGQNIVVTGGGSGIGRCIAHELAALGAMVIVTGRKQEKLDAVVAEIIQDGGRAQTQTFDIRDEDVVRANVAEILSRVGVINGLVNNAGGQFAAPLKDISQKGWETVLRTNLTGGFLMCREVLNQSMSESGGAIVNMVADFWNAMPRLGHSGAARAGMDNFTKTAAMEWVHFGVRVNAVAPGLIATSGLETYDEEHKETIRSRAQKIPVRRLGTESEISAIILFLLSPAANFITGETVRVDGGAPNMTINYDVPDHPEIEQFDGFHRSVKPDLSRK
ncbi:MAG: SDR family oxidoreductase [Gammaproteobacteria bacterium]|jgi:citronellol/citronellal dehydrogenase|nr:SDR family oxidoreductase [Gammaproteobacteria bacterium]